MKDRGTCKVCEVIVPHGTDLCDDCGRKKQLHKLADENTKLRVRITELEREVSILRATGGRGI